MYKLEYLPTAVDDVLRAEAYLYEFSSSAADQFAEAIGQQMTILAEHPLMYQIYEYNRYFRCMPLPYQYLCFYHIEEIAEVIKIHRIIREMMDLKRIL